MYTRGKPKKRDNISKNKSRYKSEVKNLKCLFCHKPGHYRRDCPERRKIGEKKHDQGEVELAQEGFDIGDVLCTSDCKKKNCWILDSECSFHMSHNKDWFESFHEYNVGQVILGNNKTCRVIGIGNIRLRLRYGTEKILQQVCSVA